MKNTVCVINQHGRPLMPTTPAKAAKLLKKGNAEIFGYRPFTIKLLIGTRGHIQPIALGIDAGYQHIGFSAITEGKELIGGELKLLENMSERLVEKRKYRRTRRNRLRHRPARFDNRTREAGWLTPSIQHKFDTHIKLINTISQRMPISCLNIETASFDIQKINNPDITAEQYQQGEQLGYQNLAAYIRHRDGYKCQNPKCANKSKDVVTQIHHIGIAPIGPQT
jgi:hypothetical protein